jgi:hypothetical protein
MARADDDDHLTEAQLRLELSLTRRKLHAHEAAMLLYLQRGEADLAGDEELAAEQARAKIDELAARLRRRRR